MCSHLVRAMLSAAGGKAHLWRSHGVWTCAWRSFTGRGATPALAWADADEKAHHRLVLIELGKRGLLLQEPPPPPSIVS